MQSTSGTCRRPRRAALLLVAVCVLTAATGAGRAQVGGPLDERQKKAAAEVEKIYSEAGRLRDSGRFADAIPLVRRALEIDEQAFGPDHSVVATDLTNLGHLYARTGDYVRAVAVLQRALKIREGRPASHALAYVLNNLAGVYDEMGDYARAEALYRRALAANEQTFGVDSVESGGSIQGLAVLYSKMGEYTKALPLYERALRIATEAYGMYHPHVATTLDGLAGLYRNTGDYAEAEGLYLTALEIYFRVLPPNHPDIATALNNLALMYHMGGDHTKARTLYEAAVGMAEESLGPNHLEVALYLNNLAALHQTAGGPSGGEKALDLFTRSLDIQQRNLADIFGISSERTMQTYLSSVQVTFDLMFAAAAGQRTPRASDAALTWLLRRKAVILDTLVRFRAARALLAGDPSVSELAERLRSVRQRMSNLPLGAAASNAGDVSREMARLREEAARLEESLNRTLNGLRPGLQTASAVDVNAVRAALPPGTALVEFARARVFDFKAAGGARRWHPARYYAFVVTPGQTAAPAMIDLGDAARLDDAVREMRARIVGFKDDWKAGKFSGDDPLKSEEAEEASFKEAAAALNKLVFAPLRKELGAARAVYISPDSQLNLVPFEALVDDEGKYLVETLSLAYVSSGRELLPAPFAPGSGAVIFAAPAYDMPAAARVRKLREFAPRPTPEATRAARAPAAAPPAATRAGTRGGGWDELRASPREAADVKKELEEAAYGAVTSYLAESALEETLKRVRSPRVLHVSTHGFFPEESQENEPASFDLSTGSIALIGQKVLRRAGDPLLKSGLVLAGANKIAEPGKPAELDDGWVTAEEIAEMELPGTELVVLSACGTALGAVSSGEGVYGLRRAFHLAGARAVVSTLFEVPDADSALLMKNFYEGLKQKKTKLDALRAARLSVISERRKTVNSAHPFFWAGFVLAGDTN